MKKREYEPKPVEERWLSIWEEQQLFQNSHLQEVNDHSETCYLLFAFAYPSGSGLHVGHVESKTALDILARYNRMYGKKVFFPVGWDAFGLPAENYAIKTGIPPAKTTSDAIKTFRRQIKRIGISYDWANEIATCHPEYYKWTQWLFLQLFNKGLAYKKTGMVNWCPSCQTVLANEQVVNGLCERCDTPVIQKDMDQWFFKITHYKDELIDHLDGVDWINSTKQHQRDWIGRKEGIHITYPVKDTDESITCFTTRPDTNFGATFVVLAPEHPFVQKILRKELEVADSVYTEVEAYVEHTKAKTELQRQQEGKVKTGAFTGFYVKNGLNDKLLPVWISDFVLAGFGTGAVVGVPGHDQRDFDFAKAFDIDIIRVVKGTDGDESPITDRSQVQEESGTMMNSSFLDGMDIQKAISAMMDHLEAQGMGKRITTYRLRDWLISRQRYWGAPIPIVYDPEGKPHPVRDEHLPWILPTDVDYNPKGTSPLGSSKELFERTEKLYGKGWTPEIDTMDTFVDSSWYFMRYMDSRNKDSFASKEMLNTWLPVDFYMIGKEHIVLHLLYSRFFTKFLRDEGYLTIDEPFTVMRHQGMILGPDNKKMSKSKGNVINPDEVVEYYGADTLRVYEMFMGPIDADKPWDDNAVAGVYRFLSRIYRVVNSYESDIKSDPAVEKALHKTISKVSADIPQLKFNTAIASMMQFLNTWVTAHEQKGAPVLSVADVVSFLKVLAPFAPFMSCELYEKMVSITPEVGEHQIIHCTTWPTWSESLASDEEVVIAIQVNGKVRDTISIPRAQISEKESILSQAKSRELISKWLDGKRIVKEIYVPGKIVNVVVV